jgi:hypothetical protein
MLIYDSIQEWRSPLGFRAQRLRSLSDSIQMRLKELPDAASQRNDSHFSTP